MASKRRRKPSKRTVASHSFEFLSLPSSVIFEILSRLSVKAVFRCHCVCKDFHRFLKTPYFTELHLSRAPTTFVLRDAKGIYQVVDVEELHPSNSSMPMVSTGSSSDHVRGGKSKNVFCYELPNREKLQLTNSVNGLVCFYMEYSSEPFYSIWNPALDESSFLPGPLDFETNSKYLGYSALGFSPKTNKYKIIRFVIIAEKPVLQLHTLGSSTWRSVEGAPAPLSNCTFDPFVNGALHWITETDNVSAMIFSLEMEKEELKPIPSPAHFDTEYMKKVSWINVGKLRDALCLCFVCANTIFEVWAMEEYGVKESWRKRFAIDMSFYCGLQVGEKDRPIGFSSNGEMWLVCSSEFLNSYNPRTRIFKDLGTLGVFETPVYGIPHCPSFIDAKEFERQLLLGID